MPATYSINNNTAYESSRLATIGDALNLLPDNTNKLISPRDARDSIYSAWETSVFKQLTGSASIEYIGIDRNGLNNKILFGKKQLGGLDVLNSTLLNYSFNDTDIFFFNNKTGITPSNTKIAFLAGTNSTLYQYAPYINSYQGTSSLHLEIVNQTGDITVDSNTGRVSINNVTFPTKLETSYATNGQILKYYNGRLIWDNNTINLAYIGSTNSITNIYGSPVLVNGHSLELTESSPIIATFGNIEPGQTFSNAPLVEVVRQMLYPHLGPDVSLLINVSPAGEIPSGFTTSAVAEFGNIYPSNIELAWSITKKSDPVISATLVNSYLGGFAPTLPISYPGLTSISGVSLGYTPSVSMGYTLSVYDSGVTNYPLDNMAIATGSSTVTYATASVTLDLVYPFFYGVSTYNAVSGLSSSVRTQLDLVIPTLNKLIEKESDKSVQLNGTGYIYYCIPGDYLSLVQVMDENGFDITSSFKQIFGSVSGTNYNPLIKSPDLYWNNISYEIWKHGPTTVVPSLSNWQFNLGTLPIVPTTTTTTTTTTTIAPTTTTTTTAYSCASSDFYSYIDPNNLNNVVIVSTSNISLNSSNLLPGNLLVYNEDFFIDATTYIVGSLSLGLFSFTFDIFSAGRWGFHSITLAGSNLCEYNALPNPPSSPVNAGVYIPDMLNAPTPNLLTTGLSTTDCARNDINYIINISPINDVIYSPSYILVKDPNSVIVWIKQNAVPVPVYNLVTPIAPISTGPLYIELNLVINTIYRISVDGCLYEFWVGV